MGINWVVRSATGCMENDTKRRYQFLHGCIYRCGPLHVVSAGCGNPTKPSFLYLFSESFIRIRCPCHQWASSVPSQLDEGHRCIRKSFSASHVPRTFPSAHSLYNLAWIHSPSPSPFRVPSLSLCPRIPPCPIGGLLHPPPVPALLLRTPILVPLAMER